MTKALEKITLGQIGYFLSELKEDNRLYRVGFSVIALKFLGEYVKSSESLFDMDFDSMRNLYIKQTYESEDKIPTDENKFYRHVCKKYLHLNYAPRNKFLGYYDDAIKDLKMISKNISYCEKNIKQLSKNKEGAVSDNLFDSKNYKIKFYEHYITKNTEAKDDIIDFLINRIKSYSFRKSFQYSHGFSFIDFDTQYAFRWSPQSYHPEYFSEWLQRLSQMTPTKYHELINLYKINKTAFYDAIDKYIKETNVIADIKSKLKNNFYTGRRESVVKVALDELDQGHNGIFCRLIAPEIEGMIHDLCLSFAVKPSSLVTSSVSNKMDLLLENNQFLYYYEYFRFRFPEYRNAIAHGKLVDDGSIELDHLAKKLLLDLHCIVNDFFEHDNPLNLLVEIVLKCRGSISENTVYALSLLSIEKISNLLTEEIAEFYNIDKTLKALEISWNTKKLWNTALRMIKSTPFGYGHETSMRCLLTFTKFGNIRIKQNKDISSSEHHKLIHTYKKETGIKIMPLKTLEDGVGLMKNLT